MIKFLKEHGFTVNLTLQTDEIINRIPDCYDKYENKIYIDEIQVDKFTGNDFSYDRKNYARGFFKADEILRTRLKDKIRILCYQIEKLPASEQQTRIIILANELLND